MTHRVRGHLPRSLDHTGDVHLRGDASYFASMATRFCFFIVWDRLGGGRYPKFVVFPVVLDVWFVECAVDRCADHLLRGSIRRWLRHCFTKPL